MTDHDRPEVIPGRYAGEAIPIHEGPTPRSIAYQEQRAHADELAGKIAAAAADAARCQSTLLELLGEFDAVGGIRHWSGFKSLAHWLSWACAMTPGVAREHVRVAKALRRMPTIAGLLREGRLSYSKVREVTRVVDVVDEHRLAELALTATASQLARMIAGFRTADGMRIKQQTKRSLSWHERDDGVIDFRIRLPKEEGAVLMAAIDAAKDQFGPPPPKPDPCGDAAQQPESAPGVGTYTRADALLDVARSFLNTAPEDRSGEDRTLVVVQVSAENLARDVADVPAETSQPTEATCHIDGTGSIETATAQKLACDNPVLGAIIDKHGKVLALGRSVSKAQRRALMIRDQMCRYPGCHSTRHLKAHHVVPWILGGRTDLEKSRLPYAYHVMYGDRGQDHDGARVLAGIDGSLRSATQHRRTAQRKSAGRG